MEANEPTSTRFKRGPRQSHDSLILAELNDTASGESLHNGGYHPGDLAVSQAMGALELSSEWDTRGRIRIVLSGPDDCPKRPLYHQHTTSRAGPEPSSTQPETTSPSLCRTILEQTSTINTCVEGRMRFACEKS